MCVHSCVRARACVRVCVWLRACECVCARTRVCVFYSLIMTVITQIACHDNRFITAPRPNCGGIRWRWTVVTSFPPCGDVTGYCPPRRFKLRPSAGYSSDVSLDTFDFVPWTHIRLYRENAITIESEASYYLNFVSYVVHCSEPLCRIPMVEYAILACHYTTFQNNNTKHYVGNGPDVVIKAYCRRAITSLLAPL